MSAPYNDPNPDVFLAQAAWLHRLAQRLVSPQEADDLVQDTFAAFAARPPEHAESPRGWLGQVARNLGRMGVRSQVRRTNRELASPVPEAWPEPEELLGRAQNLRRLCEAVESLDEPFRSTVLRHYFEGQTLAEIARREGCPAATVRGRLKTGLTRLRGTLDQSYGGTRADWLAAFAPIAAAPSGTSVPASGIVMGTTGKVITTVATLGLAAGCASFVLQQPSPSSELASVVAPTDASPPNPASSDAAVRPTSEDGARTKKTTRPITAENPPDSPGAKVFEDDADRERRRAAVHEARVARLTEEGLPADFIEEVSADTQLLSIVESMMMMEDAGRLATACAEVSPPGVRGKLYADVEFIGEPDVGTVIETITLDEDRSTPGMGEFAECVEESLFMLSLAPPAVGGTQVKTLFFDTHKEHVLTGTEIRRDAERKGQ